LETEAAISQAVNLLVHTQMKPALVSARSSNSSACQVPMEALACQLPRFNTLLKHQNVCGSIPGLFLNVMQTFSYTSKGS